jgi:hypothetical protein
MLARSKAVIEARGGSPQLILDLNEGEREGAQSREAMAGSQGCHRLWQRTGHDRSAHANHGAE